METNNTYEAKRCMRFGVKRRLSGYKSEKAIMEEAIGMSNDDLLYCEDEEGSLEWLNNKAMNDELTEEEREELCRLQDMYIERR